MADNTNNSSNEKSTTTNQTKIDTGNKKLDATLMSMNSLIIDNCNAILKKIDSKTGSLQTNQQEQISQITSSLAKQIEANTKKEGINVVITNNFGNNNQQSTISSTLKLHKKIPSNNPILVKPQILEANAGLAYLLNFLAKFGGKLKDLFKGGAKVGKKVGKKGAAGIGTGIGIVISEVLGDFKKSKGQLLADVFRDLVVRPTKRQLGNLVDSLGVKEKLREGFNAIKNMPDVLKGIANEVATVFNETIPTALESYKAEFSVGDRSFLGTAYQKIGVMAKEVYSEFSNMDGEYYRLYENVEKYMTSLSNNLKALGDFGEIYGKSLTQNEILINHFERARRALALSDEDINNLVKISSIRNESIYESFNRIKVESDKAAQKFNLNQKSLTKDVNSLRKNFVTFGHLSERELFNLVGRFKQLGVAVSDLDKLMGFDTFETAVESASQLHQAFGMNVDALKLIKAENPGEIADIFVNAFRDTGMTYEDLNFRQKKFLNQQTKMSDDMLRLMMNDRLSFEEAQKKFGSIDPNDDENLQKQIESFKALDHSIPQTKKIKTFTSSLDAMKQGLKDAMRTSKGLKNSFLELSTSMTNVYSKFTGSDPEFTNKLNKAFSDLSHYVDRITEAEVTPALERIFDKIPNAISGIGQRMDASLNDAQRKKIQSALDKEIEVIAKDMVEQYTKTKGLVIDTLFEGVRIAAQGFIPMAEKMIKDINEILDSFRDSAGFIDSGKIFEKLGINDELKDRFSNIVKDSLLLYVRSFFDLFTLNLEIFRKSIFQILSMGGGVIGGLFSENENERHALAINEIIKKNKYDKLRSSDLDKRIKKYQKKIATNKKPLSPEEEFQLEILDLLHKYDFDNDKKISSDELLAFKDNRVDKNMNAAARSIPLAQLKDMTNDVMILQKKLEEYEAAITTTTYAKPIAYNSSTSPLNFSNPEGLINSLIAINEFNKRNNENSSGENSTVNVTLPVFINDESGMIFVGEQRINDLLNSSVTVTL